MGQAIKQVAVVAAAVAVASFTGQAQFLVSAIGATGATVVGALAGAVVAGIAGKALGLGKLSQDDIQPIDSYATNTLRNDANNNKVEPVIYGEVRIGGNLTFRDLTTGGNSDLYEIIAVSKHELNSFEKVFANNIEMTQGTGGYTDNWTFANDKILVKVYTKKPATPIQVIQSHSAGTWAEVDLSSLTFQNGTFLAANVPEDRAFMVVHHIYNATDNPQRKEITCQVQGKKIRPINSTTEIGSTPVYSNNPAEIILDYLTSTDRFNLDDSKIDIETFYNSKLLNTSYGFLCNIAFGSASNYNAEVQEILAVFRGKIIFSQGVWKLKQDEANRVPSFNLTGSDIISGSFSWSQKKARDIANTTQVSFIEPNDQWQTKLSTEFQDTDLLDSDGREYKKTITIRGCTDSAQADKISELALNQFRYTEDSHGNRIKVTPLVCQLKTTIKNAELEVGDMGAISYEELPSVKKFVIIAIKTKQSGELDVSLQEYADTHYKDSGGSPIIS